MNKFKLNFYRFADYEESINVGITMDTSTLPSSAQKVNSIMNDVSGSIMKVVEANEKLAIASGSAKTSMKTVAEGGIRRLNANMSLTKQLMNSPFASDKYIADATTRLSQTKNKGLSNYKITDAASLSQGDVNKVLSAGGSLTNFNLKEVTRQEKELTKYSKIGIDVLEKQALAATKSNTVFGKLSSTLLKTSNNTDKAGNSFGKTLDKLKHYAVSWRIVYGVFQSIWNTLSETFEKAAAYQEALNLYNVAMGEYADKGREWAERISTALYLDPKQILQYTGAFYNLVQGLGVGADAAYKMATNLTQLSYDMSSYLNIDVEAAHDKLQSAITGQSRAVASAGIAMQQASLQELAYALGIEKSVSEMTQAEKTYLRYIQIMRSTKNMQTDLARTIISPENAVRVLKQQFELLGRSIGQVFIPIVMKAIPYVMAFTQILGNMADTLANMLGFKLAKIDYDYLNLREVDTAVEDTMNNVSDSAGKAASSIGSSINRTLAAFDELNVVESESGGSRSPGIGGLGGDGSDILGDLEKYITGYDMLEGLNDQLTKETEAARKNLEKLAVPLKILEGIIATIMGFKLFKWIATVVLGAKELFGELLNITGIGSKVAGATSNLSGVFETFGSVLQVVAGAVMSFLGGFDLGKLNAISNATGESIFSADNALRTLGDTILVVGGLILAFVVGGPIALLIAAVATMIGFFAGWKQEQRELEEEIRRQEQAEWELQYAIKAREEAMENSFRNGGIHLGSFVDKFKEGIPPIEEFAEKITNVASSVEIAQKNTDDSALAFLNLHNQIVMGTDDDKVIENLATATDKFKDSLKKSEDAHVEFHKTILGNLKQEGKITEEEYNERLEIVKRYYQQSTLYQSNYADEVAKLDRDFKNGTIKTQEEYDAALQKIMDKYDGLIPSTELLGETTSDLQLIMARKIDFGSFEEAEEQINDLKDAYQSADEAFKTSRKSIEDEYNAAILGLEKDNERLAEKLKDPLLSDARKKQLTDQMQLNKDMLEQNIATRDAELQDLTEKHEAMKAQYKNYLGNILAQMVQNRLDTQEEAKETVKVVEEELRGLNDIDITGAEDDALGKYFQHMLATEEKARPQLRERLYDNGIDITDALWSAMRGEIPSQVNKTEDYWNTAMESPLEAQRKKANEEGRSFVSKYTTGIFENMGVLKGGVNNLTDSVQTEIDKKPLTFKMNTNLNPSYNTILRGFQTFANSKWGPAIEALMNNTGLIFKGLKLTGATQFVYNAFKKLNISFFAEGGYPTSGDLFFANENGNAEYITSLGNRTAVANQDQMVRAITDAILVGMQSIETNRGITQVYIGNEKVYEGQGTYQNRQADRYGTIYVKI